jgi:hypothetical protein
MSLRVYIEQIESANHKLYHQWEYTKSQWNDPVSQKFEANVLIPLFKQIYCIQRELETLYQVIDQAKRNIK